MKRLQRARRQPGPGSNLRRASSSTHFCQADPVLKVSRYSQIVLLLGIVRPMLTEPKQIGAGSGGSRWRWGRQHLRFKANKCIDFLYHSYVDERVSLFQYLGYC